MKTKAIKRPDGVYLGWKYKGHFTQAKKQAFAEALIMDMRNNMPRQYLLMIRAPGPCPITRAITTIENTAINANKVKDNENVVILNH